MLKKTSGKKVIGVSGRQALGGHAWEQRVCRECGQSTTTSMREGRRLMLGPLTWKTEWRVMSFTEMEKKQMGEKHDWAGRN